jgi:hypothetical protein
MTMAEPGINFIIAAVVGGMVAAGDAGWLRRLSRQLFRFGRKAFAVACVAHVARASLARVPPVHWGEHDTPLWQAVGTGDRERVQLLLSAHAHADEGVTLGPFGVLACITPLFQAVRTRDDVATVEALLAAGADVRAGVTVGPLGALMSVSPLFEAAGAGHAATVDALLAAGAAVDVGMQVGPFGALASTTPLYAAAQHGHADVVRALLTANANMGASGVARGLVPQLFLGLLQQATPLAVAARNNHATVVALLRAHADAQPARNRHASIDAPSSLGNCANRG